MRGSKPSIGFEKSRGGWNPFIGFGRMGCRQKGRIWTRRCVVARCGMSKKCIWCATKEGELSVITLDGAKGEGSDVTVCSDECGTQIHEFSAFAQSHIVHFLVGLLVLPALGLIPLFWGYEGLSLLLICGFMGGTMILFPFATPQTMELLGARKSALLARIMGALIVCTGIILMFVLPNASG